MIIEAAGNFLSGKNTNPCRGQLDSQGDAVHPANDGLNRSSDILAQLESWLYVTGSISKKPGRIRRPCIDNGGTGHTSSPARSSGERLVARIATDGQLRNSTSAARRAASRTCSQQS